MINTYLEINPDIIPINSHGLKEEGNTKIGGYNSYNKNIYNEIRNMKYTIKDDFITNVLEIILETSLGKVSVSTTYLPPRRQYLPFLDLHKLAYNNYPTYILADMNCQSRVLNHTG